jgi:hypothetical protein
MATTTKRQAFMEKHKHKPWVENYPPLARFLEDSEARCAWQLRLGGSEDEPTGYVEQYIFPNGKLAIVVVHARQGGWDIFIPSDSPKVEVTLAEATKRLGLAGKAA